MSDSPTPPKESKVTQDRGFKRLFSAYPVAAFKFFAREIVVAKGLPVSIEVLVQHEVMLEDLNKPSRFLDIALIATYANGDTIILVEHWSSAREVDHARVVLYAVSLKLRHPKATILPVIFVTDPKATVVGEWSMPGWGREAAVALKARVVRITSADIARLEEEAQESRVAAAMRPLAYGPGIDSAVKAGVAFAKAPGTIDDFRLLLPLIEELAMLGPEDVAEYRRRLIQEPGMSIIEEWIAETKAEGKTEGALATILHMVAKGRATIDGARAEIADLVAAGTVTRAQADEALAKLG